MKPLTPSQSTALEALHNFLADTTTNEFCLIGAAGSGKSFTIQHFCSTWEEEYKKRCKQTAIEPTLQTLHITATTNKAATLLHTLEHPATTIHKLLGVGVDECEQSGNVGLKEVRAKFIENAIIIVDEASMVNWEIHKYIHEKTLNCKIIYVGDATQLPPVKSVGNLPLVFNQGFPEARLTEDVRQLNAPKLLHLCKQLRHIVNEGDLAIELPEDCEVQWLSPAKVKPIVEQHFKHPTTQDKILTYTNKRCKDYSDFISTLQYPDALRDPLLGNLIVGERVMCNEGYSTFDGSLYTGQELTITSLEQTFIPYDDEHAFDGVKVKFKETDVVGLVPVDTYFYNNLLDYYRKNKAWKQFFALKNKILDIIRPYSLTIHKSQGSTYPTVFVDMDDALTCSNGKVRKRLLYVAVSRASQQLYLFGSEASRKKFTG